VDRRGVAVEGAEVLILDGFHGKAIGCAKTGVDGSFSLTLEKEVCEVSFEVTKPGFARWAWIEDGDALVDRLVCLEREISRERIAEITAEKDLEERLWRILEVLHGGDELFAYIGDMRPDLLRIANSGAFSRLDSRYESPLTRALLLLMLWQDPQDQELLARALMKALNEPENENYRFCRVCFLSRLPEKEIAGKSFDEVIDRWYEWHCIQEKINGRRPPHCVKKKIVDLSEQHAYITIDVRYAHWGYEQNLVLLRTEGLWRLKLNITGLQYNLR
jgi:hypothetical protein